MSGEKGVNSRSLRVTCTTMTSKTSPAYPSSRAIANGLGLRDYMYIHLARPIGSLKCGRT